MAQHTTVLLCVVLAAFVAFPLRAPAEPPTISDLAGLSVTGPLTGTDKKLISDYTTEWIKRLISAKKMSEVDAALKALLNGYRVHPSSVFYQLEYARAVAAGVPGAMTLTGDALHRAKEVRVAMVVASMNQITIEPALVLMLQHSNPGVRYWAAKGFRLTGRLLLIQGGDHAKTMLASLGRAGRKEASGPVLARILDALGPHPGVSGRWAVGLNAVLDNVWLARCKGLREGKREVVEAYRRALVVLERLPNKLRLQLLADAMEAASKGFFEATKAEKSEEAEALAEVLGTGKLRAILTKANGETQPAILTADEIDEVLCGLDAALQAMEV
ncbi:hypothetical protein LCGC14_1954090 [marine sediment metagenome]|uniref:Uncharacterized protein n=1 Tax=marine sediment metagenome TaxID=412755 RepID=A0A0F9IDM7_9ZZZZ